jgi:oxygen-independent coproporphyrinogen-3 oxidase
VELNDDDVLRREVITKLMCNFYLDKNKINGKYNITFDDYFADALLQLKGFEEDGLIQLKKYRLEVTPTGRLVIRNIAMCFDFYMNQKEAEKPQFSRTV